MKIQTKIPEESLPRWQKLLLVLSELSRGSKKPLRYEEIVVAAFKKYPETFHLRGYKEYPDSGDLVHKPLYDMKPKGLLTAVQKEFSLTEKGLQAATRLSKLISKGGIAHYKPSRDVGKEVDRVLASAAYNFFREGNIQKIFDTDFFQYLGVSVHTSKNEFLNRVATMDHVIEEAKSYKDGGIVKSLKAYHEFMLKDKFKSIVEAFTGKKERNL